MAGKFGLTLERLSVGGRGQPLRKQAHSVLFRLLSALATAELATLPPCLAPPSRPMPLVDAAAAAVLARLGDAAPPFGHLDEEAALRALGRQRHELKPLQLEALAAWRRGHDFLGQLPCGFGKTLLFQLPALLAPGSGSVAGEAASPNVRGPSAADVAAASAMKPSEQRTMAEGMVAQLESRLAKEPKNLDGWVMLMRSRMTLGEPAKAKAALEAAVKANPGDAAELRAQAAGLGIS